MNESFFIPRFLTMVEAYPQSPALVAKDSVFSYADLLHTIRPIAAGIQDVFLSEDLIPLWVDESVDAHIWLIAVVFSGKAYLPLHKKWSEEKVLQVLNDAGLSTVLCRNKEEGNRCRQMGIQPGFIREGSVALEKSEISEAAYVLYTSGSTGLPKGVMIQHSQLNVFFDYFFKEYAFGPRDRFLQVYELTFDVSVFSLFMPLLCGASAWLLPASVSKPLSILKYAREWKITVLSMVPGTLHYMRAYFAPDLLPDLSFSFFSGDALYHQVAMEWKKCIPNAEIHNFYGPTETCIVCSRYIWQESDLPEENGIVPIGSLFPGVEAFSAATSSEDMNFCLTGPQVISSYWGDSNREAFFESGDFKYYKTGDKVYLNKAGNWCFSGRVDRQVKWNGYRIQPEEVEELLRKKECGRVYALLHQQQGCWYFCVEKWHLEWEEELKGIIPYYFSPFIFVHLELWPENLNGKTDVNQLKLWIDLHYKK